MNTLTAIIVEDEKNGREALQSLLEMFCPRVKLIGMVGGIASAKPLIQKHRPDLLFLDILLGQENGFDLLEALAPVSFQIIFTTSLDSFALQAFKANAVDYLLKPIEPDALVRAVKKAEQLNISNEEMQSRFAYLLKAFDSRRIGRISIPSQNNGISMLELDNIVYVQGDGAYSTFHTKDHQQLIASNNLGHYSSILPENDFFRAHQSYLVNINQIKRIFPTGGLIELLDGTQIPISRSRRKKLIGLLQGFC